MAPGDRDITDFHQLLLKTSRTFALSIPVLEAPLCDEVGLAYLLFRIADTFEDAYQWTSEQRIGCLEEFARLVEGSEGSGLESAAQRWLRDDPTVHAGYRELLAAAPEVLAAYRDLKPSARAEISRHVARTCRGMADFVRRSDAAGRLELRNLGDLRGYCYVVAGIVGELLTELFLLEEPTLAPVEDGLRRRSAAFGEALQLVNILKDSAADAQEGRSFLPRGAEREPVVALARQDLATAAEYVRLLQASGCRRGVVAFTALPLLLAREALARVEASGPGAKVGREVVLRLVAELDDRLGAGLPAV